MTTLAEPPFLEVSAPGFATNSPEVFRARERSWYARTEYGLAILRYEDVSTLLRDQRLRQGSRNWPSLNGITSGPFYDWWIASVINLEGPAHDRLRRLMNPAFSPRLIRDLTPRFQSLANELIDTFVDDGHCEYMSQFARPYAGRVIAIILGLPEDEWPDIVQWSSQMGLALGVNIARDIDIVHDALEGLYGFADRLIEERTAQPREDTVTRLVQAQTGGQKITLGELRDTIVNLIFAGMETTANQLGLGMQTFIDNRDQWVLLGQQPELGAAAVEEMMRTNPTVTWVTREALIDFEYKGLDIKAGTTIHMYSQSASSDPRVFGEPTFDITVPRAKHFGFGAGLHHCVGHYVARADMTEALPLLARRLLDPRRNGPGTDLPKSGNTGPLTLPIAFVKGAHR